MSFSRASSAVVVAFTAVLLVAGSAQATPPPLQLTEAAHGLSSPVYIASTGADPSAIYVVEQTGRIQRVVGDVTDPRPFFDIHTKVTVSSEEGLLSMAFSPAYATNHLFFVYYVDHGGKIRVAEYRARPPHKPSLVRILLTVKHPKFTNHYGGQLQFGPDGMLYAGLGDGGSGGDPANNAQNPASRLGKLLRAAGPSFTDWTVAGYGVRNPWRYSFDSVTGDLYIGDVGQDAWEEIDYRTSAQLATPVNYGWSRYEGLNDYNTGITVNPPDPPVPLVFPVYEYDHATNHDCAVLGGYVYRGTDMPDEVGRYFFADLCTGIVRSLVVSGGVASDERDESDGVPSPSSFEPSSFGVDAAGELYIASLGTGAVYRFSEP